MAEQKRFEIAEIVNPGDTFIIGISAGEYEMDIFEGLEEELPGVKIVIFNGANAFAVYRPDSYTE